MSTLTEIFCPCSACVIDTYDSDFSAKVIMITWHANIARRSAGLGTLLNSEDHDVAEAFHRESVTCLHKATKHSEVVEILEDFSQEALSDLELKDVAFRSREFIINCLQLLQNLLYSPCYQVRERGRHTEILPTHANRERIDAEIKKIATRSARTQRFPVRSSGAGLGYGAAQPTMALSPSLTSLGSGYGGQDDDGEEGGELMSEEQQQRLKVIAVERMKLVFCIFKVSRQPRSCLNTTAGRSLRSLPVLHRPCRRYCSVRKACPADSVCCLVPGTSNTSLR